MPSREELSPIQFAIIQQIQELILLAGGNPSELAEDLIQQIIYSSLKMLNENYDMGQLKLMTRAFKEMRYAYSIFNQYRGKRCVSLFGSARTSSSHPDYQAAKEFGAAMAAKNWFCMTGAAQGIMQAGLEGAPKDGSFGLSIRLPFEEVTHTLLSGDPKLINFRYFFTRKLMFLSYSDALSAFPGGVGTQDELFEALTLMQTGRSNIVPVVLLEGEGGTYWSAWEHYIQHHLLAKGFISPEDCHFYYHAPSVEAAVEHILKFYKRYHSNRYVQDTLVLRLLTPLNEKQIAELNQDFTPLIQQGMIYATPPFAEENDHLDLPRLAFQHNRRHYGLLRALIDRINNF